MPTYTYPSHLILLAHSPTHLMMFFHSDPTLARAGKRFETTSYRSRYRLSATTYQEAGPSRQPISSTK